MPTNVLLKGFETDRPGRITPEPLQLCVREVEKKEPLEEDPLEVKVEVEVEVRFRPEKSIFGPRKVSSDGHSLFTTKRVLQRAFDIDWSRRIS